jgi:hypothetical protein
VPIRSAVLVLLIASAGQAWPAGNAAGASTRLSPGRASPAVGAQDDTFEGLLAEALQALAREGVPFVERARLVSRLDRAARASAGESRARLTLLWLRGIRWLLSAVPFDITQRDEPYRSWLAAHDEIVVYSEPSGQWLIEPDLIWRAHDEHRRSATADAIAWLAVENRLPGECEGYVPCYGSGLNRLEGEYLRRHPDGAHAAQALEQVHEALTNALELLARPDGIDFLNPATDCGDLRASLVPLRDAIIGAPGGSSSQAVIAADRLLSMCP